MEKLEYFPRNTHHTADNDLKKGQQAPRLKCLRVVSILKCRPSLRGLTVPNNKPQNTSKDCVGLLKLFPIYSNFAICNFLLSKKQFIFFLR